MNGTEYTEWIGKLMGRGLALKLPKDTSGQLALMGAASLALEPGRRYTEKEVNDTLGAWLKQVSPRGGLDYVTLRRYLVEFRFLARESDGSAYWVDRDELAQEFESDVLDLDTATLIQAFKEAEAARRAQWLAQKKG